MKPSYYNHLFQRDGELVLYNAYTGSFELFPKPLVPYVLDILENKRSFEHPLLQAQINHLALRLKQGGFLIDSDRDELEEIKLIYRAHKFGYNPSKQFNIAIAPSLHCNFDCSYCYAAVKSGEIMNEKTRSTMIARILEYMENAQKTSLNICWIGGEPLTDLKSITQFSQAFYDYCSSKKGNFGALLVTNGSLLTKQLVEKLENPPFNVNSIQLTIDGYWHENSRPFRNKMQRTSLSAVEEGIHNSLCSNKIDTIIRVNVPSGQDIDVSKLGDFIIDLKRLQPESSKDQAVHFYLAEVHGTTENSRINVDQNWEKSDFAKFKVDVERYICEKLGIRRTPGFSKPQFISCGYEVRDSFVFDAHGYIYKCWHHIGVEEKSIGHIQSSLSESAFLLNEPYRTWLSWDPFETMCVQCKYLPICGGFCFDIAYERGFDSIERCMVQKFCFEQDSTDQMEAVLEQRFQHFSNSQNHSACDSACGGCQK